MRQSFQLGRKASIKIVNQTLLINNTHLHSLDTNFHLNILNSLKGIFYISQNLDIYQHCSWDNSKHFLHNSFYKKNYKWGKSFNCYQNTFHFHMKYKNCLSFILLVSKKCIHLRENQNKINNLHGILNKLQIHKNILLHKYYINSCYYHCRLNKEKHKTSKHFPIHPHKKYLDIL